MRKATVWNRMTNGETVRVQRSVIEQFLCSDYSFTSLSFFHFFIFPHCPFYIVWWFNPIQDGRKTSPTSFSPVTAQNVGISLQKLVLFPYWCKNSSSYLVPVINYWTWTETTAQKKRFFWSNLYKIDVMITSLIEVLELPNFGHMTTSRI